MPIIRKDTRLRRLDPHRRLQRQDRRRRGEGAGAAGADVTRISLADYPLPIMDQDLEKEKGVPENAVKLARLIAAHDGCSDRHAGIQRLDPAAAQEHDRLGEPRPQATAASRSSPIRGKVAAHLLVLRRQFRRHPRRSTICAPCCALSDGGDHAAGLGGRWRRGLRRGRQVHARSGCRKADGHGCAGR